MTTEMWKFVEKQHLMMYLCICISTTNSWKNTYIRTYISAVIQSNTFRQIQTTLNTIRSPRPYNISSFIYWIKLLELSTESRAVLILSQLE